MRAYKRKLLFPRKLNDLERLDEDESSKILLFGCDSDKRVGQNYKSQQEFYT